MSETTIPLMTPRQVILHSADLLLAKQNDTTGKPIIIVIKVQGQVALWDPELCRLDIAHKGAKLIVRTPASCCINETNDTTTKGSIQVGSTVVVQGVLKKEQRRTFLEATQVLLIDSNHCE
ncbi:MAG: hypothetical protein SGBAC_012322 [Bacillariaceae sp.]